MRLTKIQKEWIDAFDDMLFNNGVGMWCYTNSPANRIWFEIIYPPPFGNETVSTIIWDRDLRKGRVTLSKGYAKVEPKINDFLKKHSFNDVFK